MPNSTKLPGSSSRSSRSRTGILPRLRWRATCSGPPIASARVRRASRSSSIGCQSWRLGCSVTGSPVALRREASAYQTPGAGATSQPRAGRLAPARHRTHGRLAPARHPGRVVDAPRLDRSSPQWRSPWPPARPAVARSAATTRRRHGGGDDHDAAAGDDQRAGRDDSSAATTTATGATTAPGGAPSTTARGSHWRHRGVTGGQRDGGRLLQDVPAGADRGRSRLPGRELDAATLVSLDDAVANGSEATDEASPTCSRALVVCEPKSYVDSQVRLIKESTKATQDEATCVVHKANALFAADADLLALASGDQSTSDWPAADKDKLRTAIASCASSDLVDQIIESVVTHPARRRGSASRPDRGALLLEGPDALGGVLRLGDHGEAGVQQPQRVGRGLVEHPVEGVTARASSPTATSTPARRPGAPRPRRARRPAPPG